MATTLTTEHSFTGDGSTTNYSVTFTYLKEADVKVTLDHLATTAYSFANASTIQFNTAPTSGAKIRIYRDTDVDAARFSFSSGNSLKSGELNENLDQLLYADQELISEEGLANESVSTPKLRDAGVLTSKIGDSAVTTAKIADLNVTTAKINDSAVTTAKINDAAVTNAKLADNSVSLAKMQDNSVDTPELVDSSVTTAKINNLAVTNDKLADNSVSLAKMQDNSVDTAELVDNAVTTVKITDLNVTTAKINDLAVTTGKLAADAVTTVKVLDDAITEPKLAANSVTNRQIADGSISGAKITDGTLDLQAVLAVDIRTLAEQNASPNDAGSDDELGTTAANNKRYDTIYEAGTPSGTDFATGKMWYDHANDQTLSVWSGTNWLGISSGGTFISQPTVIWVDQANGVDTNDGHRIIDSMKTIKAAVASADHGDIVLVAPGIYRESVSTIAAPHRKR